MDNKNYPQFEFYSAKNKAVAIKQARFNKAKHGLITASLMLVPVALIVLIVLDWLRVFRLSWMF